MTRSVRTVVAALAALLLGACASIPTSGPVQPSDRQAATEENQSIRVLARPPAPGATPAEVVTGFLRASASSENDYAVAREYLAAPATDAWDPATGVRVYDPTASTEVQLRGATSSAFVASSFVGRIGANGEFSSVQRRRLVVEFTFTQVDGEWRLTQVPDGLVLSTLDVQRTFRVADVYFPTPDDRVLVPDAVYVPAQRPIIRERLVEAVVRGPSTWLAPAVRSAFPSGTRVLEVGRPSDTGVIDVELSAEALTAPTNTRRLMLAQLVLTLTGQLSEVSGVRVRAGGSTLALPGTGSVVRRADVSGFEPANALVDTSAYVILDGHLNILSDEPQRPVTGFFGNGPDLSTAAVSLDGALRAGVSVDGTGPLLSVGAAGDPAASILFRGAAIGPLSFDRDRALWFVHRPAVGPDELYVAADGAPPVRVEVVGLGSRRVVSMRVSVDGARVAMVLQGAGAPELVVARVERSGAAPVVDGLRRLQPGLVEVTDVAWVSGTSLLVVARDDVSAMQAYVVGVDGGSGVTAGSVPGIDEVAAAPGRARLAGSDDAVVWSDVGSGWRQVARGDHPFYPG